MPLDDFIKGLAELGLPPTTHGADKVSFRYRIESGKFAEQEITLGFVVSPDFPLSPPTGPHIKPRLLPLNPQSGPHPTHGIHESSQFGSEWEYWSRPMNHWAETSRSVADVMRHVRRLFDTQ
jgi:hypothetical protein